MYDSEASLTVEYADVRSADADRDPVSLRVDRIGVLTVAQAKARTLSMSRTPAHVRAGGTERLLLVLLDAGCLVARQDGHVASIECGEFFLLDGARPFSLDGTVGVEARIFGFPRSALGAAEQKVVRLTATPLHPDHVLTAFLVPALAQLTTTAVGLREQTREQLARNVVGIMATLVADHLLDLATEDSPRETLVSRVKDYARDHLDDPELGPQAIAVAHHISVRYLHKIFAPEETSLSRWVRQQRLRGCKDDLTLITNRHTCVAAIGRRWGFASAPHFSRAFRDAYGMSPSEWQMLAGSSSARTSEAVG